MDLSIINHYDKNLPFHRRRLILMIYDIQISICVFMKGIFIVAIFYSRRLKMYVKINNL